MTIAHASEREYHAAAHLLEGLWFASEHLYPGENGIDWDGIESSVPRSSGEVILVDLALTLWTGRSHADFIEAMRYLDDANWRRFLEALEIARPRALVRGGTA